jgi:hypothetical protein
VTPGAPNDGYASNLGPTSYDPKATIALLADTAGGLNGVLATHDRLAGNDPLSSAHAATPACNGTPASPLAAFDAERRNGSMAQATMTAVHAHAILSHHQQPLVWAARRGYVVDPDRGGATSTRFVSRSK